MTDTTPQTAPTVKVPDAARFTVKHSKTTPLRNLIGLADFAIAAGVEYDTITAYRTRGRLPEPAAEFGRTPVWTRRQLNSWLSARRATVGGRK